MQSKQAPLTLLKQFLICRFLFFTPLQRAGSNLPQVKIAASAVSKLHYVSNNPFIKL